jgi:hypothetical protein
MKRSAKYVGLDVHQATTFASVRIAGGRVIARSVLPTESAALVEFFAGMRGSIHVAFEEGTQAQWLHDVLAPVTDHVLVCDRRGEPRGNKGDRMDADRISRRLLSGDLRAVFHGNPAGAGLREVTRAYTQVVEDSTRTKLRLKALFRARAIRTPGKGVYMLEQREHWLDLLPDRGTRFRAEVLYAQLEVLHRLRPKAQAAMIAQARRNPAWPVLRSIPYLGPVRTALLLATMKTPLRFRTKRNLWAYAGLAVVTQSSAEYDVVGGRPLRRQRSPLTRGLNPNHNRILKNVFKGAATAASSRPGPLRDYYEARVAQGMREDMARLTLARKIAALTLRLWKTGEPYDAARLTVQST